MKLSWAEVRSGSQLHANEVTAGMDPPARNKQWNNNVKGIPNQINLIICIVISGVVYMHAVIMW